MPDLRVWALDVSDVRFSLVLTDQYVGQLSSYAVLIEVLVASLSGFTQLQHFQFDGANANISPVIVTEDLGNVGTLDFWTGQCPTLRSVTLFGANLP